MTSRPGRFGRNEPCPCGGTKKWKHCCGAPGRKVEGRKLSDCLLAIASPEIDDAATKGEAQVIMQCAAMAWNLAVLGERIEDADLQDRLAAHPGLRTGVDHFGSKKRAQFPDDNRVVLDVDVLGAPGGWQVVVRGARATDPGAADAAAT